jgi:hypothetical protein
MTNKQKLSNTLFCSIEKPQRKGSLSEVEDEREDIEIAEEEGIMDSGNLPGKSESAKKQNSGIVGTIHHRSGSEINLTNILHFIEELNKSGSSNGVTLPRGNHDDSGSLSLTKSGS